MGCPLTRQATCLWQIAVPSTNILPREYEALSPPAYLIHLLWPLTAGAICLWRMAVTTGTTGHRSSAPPFISLLHPGCEALSPGKAIMFGKMGLGGSSGGRTPSFQAVWLLTARTICSSQIRSAATFLSLLLVECEASLPRACEAPSPSSPHTQQLPPW